MVVVGAGGAGLRATFGMAEKGLKVVALAANTFFAVLVAVASAVAVLKLTFGG